MKKYLFFGVLLGFLSCKEKSTNKEVTKTIEVTEVTEKAFKTSEWKELFNGSSFSGWHGYLGKEVPSAWKLEEGAMVLHQEEKQEGINYNLVSDKKYTNFILSLEWKIDRGSNSGVFWGVVEDPKYKEPYYSGAEVQILDNAIYPGTKHNDEIHKAGAIFGIVRAKGGVPKEIGQWNHCELTINHLNNTGKVVLNGKEVTNFPVHGPDWDKLIYNSTFKGWDHYAMAKTGYIALQDNGTMVAFKNIKIKEIIE